MNNLKAIGSALRLYSGDYGERFPDKLEDLSQSYQTSKKTWLCPASDAEEGRISYVYVGKGLIENVPPETILAYDADGNHPDGRNVLFADSCVMWVKEADFQKARASGNGAIAFYAGEPRQKGSPPTQPSTPVKYSSYPDRCIGERMAVETARLLQGKGNVVVLSMSGGKLKSVVAEAQVEGFRNGLQQFKEMEIEAIVGPEEREMTEFGDGMSEQFFLKVVQNHPGAKAIVSFLGSPVFKEDGRAMDASKLPKVIALNLLAVPRSMRLVKSGVVSAVIVPNYEVRWDQLPNKGACQQLFEARYLIVNQENFKGMVQKLKRFYPMP